MFKTGYRIKNWVALVGRGHENANAVERGATFVVRDTTS